jgi:hypothetical protein
LEDGFLKGGITVKKNLFILGGMILVCSFLFTLFTLVYGQEENIVKAQGRIMMLDMKKNTMIVNEKTFVWKQNSALYDEKGSPITIDKFKPNTWVYIKGEKDQNNKGIISKIYLLPKYINQKERHLYPFME